MHLESCKTFDWLPRDGTDIPAPRVSERYRPKQAKLFCSELAWLRLTVTKFENLKKNVKKKISGKTPFFNRLAGYYLN